MQELVREMISAERISARVRELAEEISRDYQGGKILAVGVLKGAFFFLADLVRHLDLDLAIDFLRVTSYGSATETTGIVEIRKDLETSVFGRDVLIVEDIVDTGLTLQYLLRHLSASSPRTLKTCTLLDKPSRRRVELQPDYTGFVIDDQFVVGYGLDFDERYRQLPSICVLDHSEGAS